MLAKQKDPKVLNSLLLKIILHSMRIDKIFILHSQLYAKLSLGEPGYMLLYAL